MSNYCNSHDERIQEFGLNTIIALCNLCIGDLTQVYFRGNVSFFFPVWVMGKKMNLSIFFKNAVIWKKLKCLIKTQTLVKNQSLN